MTSIASKQIQESKYSYELMKNSPVMSKDRKDFSRDIIVKLNGQEQILMTGLYISALILTLLIFRGIVISMILISKGSSRTDKTSKILSTASASYTLSYTCPICMDSYQSLTDRGKLSSDSGFELLSLFSSMLHSDQLLNRTLIIPMFSLLQGSEL